MEISKNSRRMSSHMLLATTHASHLVALTHIIDLLKQLDAVPVIDARVAKLMSDKCAESSPASADLEKSRLVGKQPSFFSEKEDDTSTAATELVARLVAEQIVNGNANNNAATTSTNTNTTTNTEDGEEETEMSELTKQVTRAIPSLTPAMRTQTNHSAAVLDLGARDAKRAQQLLQELLVRAMDERLLHAMRAYALACVLRVCMRARVSMKKQDGPTVVPIVACDSTPPAATCEASKKRLSSPIISLQTFCFSVLPPQPVVQPA